MAQTLELLWLDPKRAARIKKRPAWRRILDDAHKEAPAGRGDPALPGQAVPPQDGHDMLLLLARAEAIDADGVSAALTEAVRADGKLAPPLVLVAGELRFPFDELSTLKVTMTTATPFAGGDEPLKASLDAAKEFLAIPGLAPAPQVVETLTGRIREAFARVKRAVPATYLETQSDRALLEQRLYQKRVFLGDPHLRALLQAPSDKGPMLAYLPEGLTDKLPLYLRFGARLIAEAHPLADPYETQSFALEALALAREIPAAAPRR